MKRVFLEKYKDYCMHCNRKDEVFKMMQKEDENLKSLLLKSIRYEWIDILNFMGKGDISQLSFREICELYIHISRGKARTGKIQKILSHLGLINL